MIFSGLMAVTVVASLAGPLFDDRTLTGEPIWLKPFKFSVSLALYAVTWAWLLARQSTLQALPLLAMLLAAATRRVPRPPSGRVVGRAFGRWSV